MSETIDLVDGWRATLDHNGSWLCVRLHPGGQAHWGIADKLWQTIFDWGKCSVVLEMDDIAFFPSALMVELVRLHKRLAMAGGRLRLAGLQSHPHEALRMVRLDEVMSVYDTREAAVA